MRIEQIEYFDKASDWKLETTELSNLTLLVGISGVGKTRILDAIWRIKNIAKGTPANGIKWDVVFVASNGEEYRWTGEYESKTSLEENGFFWKSEEDTSAKPRVENEKLFRGETVIVERTASEIYLRGEKTVKLSPFESVVSILNQEEDIAPVYDSFKRIIRSQFTESEIYSPSEFPEFTKMAKSKTQLEDIQESGMDSRLKIALVYQCVPATFAQIKARFIEVFPQVEDVRLEPEKKAGFPSFFEEYPLLQIKEKGVKDWIRQARISSGMYKTFMHISDMFLWPNGTVVLIDEFENSLGINCIDVLTEDLLQENRRLQFILTSHHPYIINNISSEYWKVVTRKGGVVKTQDASVLRLDSSSHSAFIQLLNLEQYKEGIMSS